MNDIVLIDETKINKRGFDEAQSKLKTSLEKIKKVVNINTVPTAGGLFNLGDHKVTGAEFNNRLVQIQNGFKGLNQHLVSCIKEITQVYNVIDKLDKEYIHSILIAVNAAEEASNQAKEVAEKANKNTYDISQNIEVLQKTIEIISDFQLRIDKLEHITDIDEIWDTHLSIGKEIESINLIITENSGFKQKLEKYNHLDDIDKIWDSNISFGKDLKIIKNNIDDFKSSCTEIMSTLSRRIEEAYETISSILISIEKNSQSIEVLLNFKHKLEDFSHLREIDQMWDSQLIHRNEIESVKVNFNDFRLENSEKNEKLNKKIKILTILALGSLGFSFVIIALELIGIL